MLKQYLSDKAVAARYQIGRSSVWRLSKQSKLPKPIKLNGSTRWKLTDLEAWEIASEVGHD